MQENPRPNEAEDLPGHPMDLIQRATSRDRQGVGQVSPSSLA